jgi:hypothetical protein
MNKLSLKEIYSYSSKDLELLILSYNNNKTKYFNKLEKRNALIIHSFNQNDLIDKDIKYVIFNNINKSFYFVKSSYNFIIFN